MGTILDKRMTELQMELSLESSGLNMLEYQAVQRYMQEYATECVKASLEKAQEGNNVFEKRHITSPDNIVLL